MAFSGPAGDDAPYGEAMERRRFLRRSRSIDSGISRVPLLLLSATLLIAGVFQNEIGSGSEAMLSAGLVCLGAWLSIEVQSWHRKLFDERWEEMTEVPLGEDADPDGAGGEE